MISSCLTVRYRDRREGGGFFKKRFAMAVRACTKLESQQIGRICDQIEPNIRSMIEAGLEPLHVASALSYLTALVTVGNEFDFDEETWHLQGPELDVLCEELAECLDRSITRITRRN